MSRFSLCFLASMMMLPAVAAAAFAQTPTLNGGQEEALTPIPLNDEASPYNDAATTAEPALAPTPYPQATSGAAMDAERAQIWNSPAMLRGRAWLQEYCARSAKVTPEEAKQYMAELQNMTPSQMKLWLLKFQEQEEMIQQQQAAFNMHRNAGVQQAMGIDRATQQAYSNINRDENEKAQSAEQSLAAQQQFSQQMAVQKSADRDNAATLNSLPWGAAWANQSPWGPYAGYPMNGPGPYGPIGGAAPGYGHYHVHYHVAPSAAGGATAR